MGKQLNYRELLKNWMQHYHLTSEAAKKMFVSIWTRFQVSKEKTDEKGVRTSGENVERTD